MQKLNIGDKFPDFLGIDTDGKETRLSDFPGKKFIIYFYPKDNTPGCTAESCSLRDSNQTFIEKGYMVIGVSKDNMASHRRFIDKHGLPFLLIADTDHYLCEQTGVWSPKKVANRTYMGIARTTFVLDETGTVTHIITKVNTKNASAQLLDIIG